MALLEGSPALRFQLNNVALLVAYGAAGILLVRAARASRGRGRRPMAAWLFFAAAQLAGALGTVALFGARPYRLPPTLADTVSTFFLILSSPLMMAGFFLLPSVRLTAGQKAALSVDVGMAISAAGVVFGAFWIMPMLAAPQIGPEVRLTLVGLLALDLALLMAMSAVLVIGVDPAALPGTLVVALSTAVRIGGDVVFAAGYLEGTYLPGGPLDSVWLAGVVLMGLSAMFQGSAASPTRPPGARPRGTRLRVALSTLVPAGWIAILGGLLMADWYLHLTARTDILYWGATCSVALALLRLVMAARENLHLRAELEHRVEERTRELKDALSNVRTLRGLLPICASCKRVRDDDGYWQHLETFMRQHTDAVVSHGLCPECVRRLYPDLAVDEEPGA